jgi:hypothetical protein
MNIKFLVGFLIIVFLGACATAVYWPSFAVVAIVGGYLIEDTKKALSAFVAGILAWSLLFLQFISSEHFGAVHTFISSVAGIPALPLTLIIGGILALLGALIGVYLHKIFKKD